MRNLLGNNAWRRFDDLLEQRAARLNAATSTPLSLFDECRALARALAVASDDSLAAHFVTMLRVGERALLALVRHEVAQLADSSTSAGTQRRKRVKLASSSVASAASSATTTASTTRTRKLKK